MDFVAPASLLVALPPILKRCTNVRIALTRGVCTFEWRNFKLTKLAVTGLRRLGESGRELVDQLAVHAQLEV